MVVIRRWTGELKLGYRVAEANTLIINDFPLVNNQSND